MKRILSLAVTLCLCFSLAACGSLTRRVVDQVTGDTSSKPAESASQATTVPDFSEDESQSEPATSDVTVPVDKPDLSNAWTESSVDSPVPFGEWGKVAIINVTDAVDDGYVFSTVYTRITGFIRYNEDPERFKAILDEHNSCVDEEYEKITEDDLVIVNDVYPAILTYDVYVPEDFESKSFGNVLPQVDFDVECLPEVDDATRHGMELITNYMDKDLETQSLHDESLPQIGRVYHLAAMHNSDADFDQFVWDVVFSPAGSTDFSNNNRVDMYFAHK